MSLRKTLHGDTEHKEGWEREHTLII